MGISRLYDCCSMLTVITYLVTLNPHFAVQSGNGFNPDVELLRVCETFSFLDKLSKPLAVLSRSEAGFFH